MKKLIISLLLIISCTISPVFAAPQESMEEKTLEEFKQEAIELVKSVAEGEVGYLEKGSTSNLYDFTENAGSSNYTKYAYELGLNHINFYGGSMQGMPWCDLFVDWCFVTAFGVEDAKQMTNQNPYGSAACSSSMSYYQSVGQFYSTPEPGDQIFFTRSHTGFVYYVDDSTVYTIEGNTNSYNGVVANGGAVRAKEYALGSSQIAGYGRPNYDLIATKKLAEYQEQKEEENQRILESLRQTSFDEITTTIK